MVMNAGFSASAARTPPATVLGMSCSLRSRNSGGPSSPITARTPAGPCATKNSSPSLTPPTSPASCRHRVRAPSSSVVSTAQKMRSAADVMRWPRVASVSVLPADPSTVRAGT